tara:strand:+ start:238 stop:567 length:330 start_codon:yes stop_codon:yes gene_type:complete
MFLIGCQESSQPNNDNVIGKWIDPDKHAGGEIVIYKTANGVLVKSIFHDGSIKEEIGKLVNDSRGKRINYKNNFNEFYLINNSYLSICDNQGCFKKLKSEYINQSLLIK